MIDSALLLTAYINHHLLYIGSSLEIMYFYNILTFVWVPLYVKEPTKHQATISGQHNKEKKALMNRDGETPYIHRRHGYRYNIIITIIDWHILSNNIKSIYKIIWWTIVDVSVIEIKHSITLLDLFAHIAALAIMSRFVFNKSITFVRLQPTLI